MATTTIKVLDFEIRQNVHMTSLRRKMSNCGSDDPSVHSILLALWTMFGENFSTDWDKAWSTFRKRGKRTIFSEFSPDKYASWNPRRSNYPLSEEVGPIKRTERSNLLLWTSPGFTLVGAIIIVTFLLIYTILAPVK
ncbi:hypothetical protein RJ641_024850 [Dillenia turbinata]|uniref:Uncharacterized protein n=1 Tax=Dillenia turbinata TaxID=194707 RepID=A0AAN8VZN2_9MAGN